MYSYVNDVQNFDKIRSKKGITVIFGYVLLRDMYNLENDMKHIPKDIPILFVHSKQDSVCRYRSVSSFFNRLNNDNKELHTLEKMDHKIVVEPGNEKIIKKIFYWIDGLQKK
ncbi:PST-A protein [Plasmodium malariae]|uniref:PST-A protein n=1 Tax=Plasmodium malariae TaxID=5858 RepID=A0A1A8X6F9_PLAMA|nr:PST-A protein [Plasmodium malariae]